MDRGAFSAARGSRALGAVLVFLGMIYAYALEPIVDDVLTAPGIAYESYLARWWGAPGSEMTRPIYRITRFDTDAFQLHYGIVPGRDLTDYAMPYWPVRSFLSVVHCSAEMAEQIRMTYTEAGETRELGFTPRSGVELASLDDSLVVRIKNRSVASLEDTTIAADSDYVEANPLAFEQVLVLRKGSKVLPVYCRLTNSGETALNKINVTITFEQSFNWGRFGVTENDDYHQILAPSSGENSAFYAYSEGMHAGYAFVAGEAKLTYELTQEMNRWRVTIAAAVEELAPGASKSVSFGIEVLDAAPSTARTILPEPDFSPLDFVPVQPSSFKTAPVDGAERVTMRAVVASLERPKVRGLNLRAGFPQAFEDLNTLKDWGCNLIIAGMGEPDQTADFIARGHGQGMEMFLTGSGSFRDGAPSFNTYYEAQPPPQAIPDSHGQDEDHYYWYAIEPVLDFAHIYGKSTSEATREEMVRYWADNFAAKWQRVQDSVQPYASDANVWFYAPFPGVAHVDPIDSYDLFMHEISGKLGESLTVFPFYYGIEYNQVEYMMRRWKQARATRAVFLPMRDFMTKPSQFIRAITAARRGGADGACGFNFAVGDAAMDQQWQWKAVMLGAWANFPTQELDALSLIEEPAELVEALGMPGVTIDVESGQQASVENVLNLLLARLPKARSGGGSTTGSLRIIVDTTMPTTADVALMPVSQRVWDDGKGIVQMHGNSVYLLGKNELAIERAGALLVKFAEVAHDEAHGASD